MSPEEIESWTLENSESAILARRTWHCAWRLPCSGQHENIGHRPEGLPSTWVRLF